MRKTYKHTKGYTSKKVNRLKKFVVQTIISFLIIIAVFFTSDEIAGFKEYIFENINKTYTVSDIKNLKEKTIDSAEEIKEAVAVFSEQKVKKQEKKSNDNITFRTPYVGEITSVYGERVHPVDNSKTFHSGIDIAGNIGDTIISAAAGVVKKVGYDEVNGHYLTVEHNEKYSTSYAHMSKISVIEGEIVDANTKIGEVGSSGVSTGAHLHFCIFEDGKTIDPEIYVKLNHRQ